jgi:hypothetical protein
MLAVKAAGRSLQSPHRLPSSTIQKLQTHQNHGTAPHEMIILASRYRLALHGPQV